MQKAHEILPDLVCCSAKNLRDVDEVSSLLRTSIMSKQYGSEEFLAKLISQACVSIFPDSGNSMLITSEYVRFWALVFIHPQYYMAWF